MKVTLVMPDRLWDDLLTIADRKLVGRASLVRQTLQEMVEAEMPKERKAAAVPIRAAVTEPRIALFAEPAAPPAPPPPPPPKPQFKPVRGVTDDVWQQEIGDRDSNKYERCYIINENHNRKILGMPEIDCAEWRAEKYWRCVEDGGNVPP